MLCTWLYIYRTIYSDKPDSITLEWEHSINKPGSVEANQEYKLKCVTKNSHPPALHRYFKGGVELSQTKINYTFNNYTDTGIQNSIGLSLLKKTRMPVSTIIEAYLTHLFSTTWSVLWAPSPVSVKVSLLLGLCWYGLTPPINGFKNDARLPLQGW